MGLDTALLAAGVASAALLTGPAALAAGLTLTLTGVAGQGRLLAIASAQAGEAAVRLGLLDEAHAHFEVASTAFRGADRRDACIVELNMAVLQLRREAWADAADIAERLRHDPRVKQLALARLGVEEVAGTAAAGQGDWAAFGAHFRALEALAAAHPALADPALVAVAELAASLARRAGRPAEAATAASLAQAFADRIR